MSAKESRRAMFDSVQPAPPDPILGLTDAYLADPRTHKINLAVGVFKDAAGQTPVLPSVKAAEQWLVDTQKTKGYLPIDGSPAYARAVQQMMFGPEHTVLTRQRARTADTPGGTGALRVAADYLEQNHPDANVWLSNPTWANHGGIFAAAGVTTYLYDYLDEATNTLAFDAMMNEVQAMAAGDVMLLHGCCHNPTGVDPTPEQWDKLAQTLATKGIIPLVDFAYQGFGDGLEEDARGLRALANCCDELLICSSYSKNFGLYRDRVGALTIVAGSSDTAENVASQVRQAIRRNYSNPPAHGAEVVAAIWTDPALCSQWHSELRAMRDRINAMRDLFARSLDERGVRLTPEGNGFVVRQKGMFTMSGLRKEQVAKLRNDHGIYIVGSGRINVAGMNEQNIPTLCDAIAQVIR